MKQYTILWADDDTDDKLLMSEIIEKADKNFLIVEASNGQEALDFLDTVKYTTSLPCLIILDLNMPIMNGKTTIAKIKADLIFSSIPLIVFTSSNYEEDKKFCQSFHVEMVTKPSAYSDLETAVKKLLSFCKFNNDERKAVS
jgi:CheY-like chemotaxis protein